MSNYFSPAGTLSVIVSFPCLHCDDETVISEEIGVPFPDYTAEKASESYNDNDGSAICPNCGEEYEVNVYAGFADGYVEVDNVDENEITVEEISDPAEVEYYEQQYIERHSKYEIYHSFNNEFTNLKKLLEINLNDNGLQVILYRQIYIAAVATMETFLSDTFINLTLENPENLERFVRSHPEFGKRKFDLSEIFDQFEKIKDTAKGVILDTIYHDLPKVKEMFRSTLNINFPPLGEAIKCVMVRHDLVHRNGKTKNGDSVTLNEELVRGAINTIEAFVNTIAGSLDVLPLLDEPQVNLDDILGVR